MHVTSNKGSKEIVDEIFRKVLSFRNVSIRYKKISPDFYDFVSKTMTKNMKRRLSMKAVLNHPWIMANADSTTNITS